MRIQREFYLKDAVTLGRELLGKIIVKKREDGRIFMEE